MLPALAHFAELVLDFRRLAVLARPRQAITHHLQLLLVLLSNTDLLLVVLEGRGMFNESVKGGLLIKSLTGQDVYFPLYFGVKKEIL